MGDATLPSAVPGATVLVVDDDAAIRLLCRVNLELAGLRVVEAATIAAASAALAEESPDAVLLDVHVGRDDGIRFLEEVRRTLPRTRVAMLTGTADVDTVRGAGPDAIVSKPFDPSELVAVVERLAAEARQVG